MKSIRQVSTDSFALNLPTVFLLGAGLSAGFFSAILVGPLDFELLRRYCLSHPVAIASVTLFFVGSVSLSLKWWQALRQRRATAEATTTLRRLVTDGLDVSSDQRAPWLGAQWQTLPSSIQRSWLGRRVSAAIDLQIQRGRRYQIEADLKEFSHDDLDRQHESYSLLRIINWAMPMLGFLGTVLGISQTLGQLDTEKLATQQQEAMNELTAGLYVAFDTTAIALVLTVFLMFIQFAVSRLELTLLAKVDREAWQGLVRFLSVDPYAAQDSLLAPVRDMAEGLLSSTRELVEEQAAIWSRSIAESQQQWKSWTEQAAEKVDAGIGHRVGEALDKHVQSLGELQAENARQLDLRWHQWQTTLSDQARLAHGQQQELAGLAKTLQQLVDSTCEIHQLEKVLQDNLLQLENIARIEEASLCVGEAVAVLAASLERAGIIRSSPVKPRAASRSVHHADNGRETGPAPRSTVSNHDTGSSSTVSAGAKEDELEGRDRSVSERAADDEATAQLVQDQPTARESQRRKAA